MRIGKRSKDAEGSKSQQIDGISRLICTSRSQNHPLNGEHSNIFWTHSKWELLILGFQTLLMAHFCYLAAFTENLILIWNFSNNRWSWLGRYQVLSSFESVADPRQEFPSSSLWRSHNINNKRPLSYEFLLKAFFHDLYKFLFQYYLVWVFLFLLSTRFYNWILSFRFVSNKFSI